MELIPKAAVVAEIEKLKVHSEEAIREFGREGYMDNVLFEQSKIRICETLLSSLNTLEVKEVDIEKEFRSFLDDTEGMPRMWHSDEQLEWGLDIAKHFFELDLKAQKGEQL